MIKQCVSPPELDDRQLLMYLDGEADPETISHLERCAYCLEKTNALARLQNRWTSRLYRITCPSPLELGEYHFHMLPDPQRLIIRQHLSECPHCSREIAQLEGFFLGALAPMEDNLLGRAKILIARLVGSAGEPGLMLPALRGGTHGPITLEADGIAIVLDVQPSTEGKVSILGQVAAEDQDQWTAALVELRQGSDLQVSTTVDDLGAFHSEGIMPGSKELRIMTKDSSLIVISNFEVPS